MSPNAALRSTLAGLAVLGSGLFIQQASVTYAASPKIAVTASHAWIAVDGSHFSTSGRAVRLYAYGIVGGAKHLITSARVTPQESTVFKPGQICLLGVLCHPGSFIVNLRQPFDPCAVGGYSHIEVDAWTTGTLGHSYEATWSRTLVACPPPVINPK